MRFLKWLVILIIFLNVVFTVAAFYAFIKVGREPTTLIAAWFTFTTGELWAVATIKKKEIEQVGVKK